MRDLPSVLDEASGLAAAIHLRIAGVETVRVSRISPSHLFGKGGVEAVGALVREYEPSVVIVNYSLSPVQQRNLEKAWKVKVIDRTGLILEIFGERAQTKEGRIQVDLAALEYQRSRLVRSWTHLERQRGGAGFMGGPGETQLEIDRRIITDRIARLKKDLEKVRRTRDLSRRSREKVPFPVVALVGYTNAGKSTLFNRLTGAEVFAENLLFATLDPTVRRVDLPSGRVCVFSDTVGFISDLPTHLVAAFRATLEQAADADVIVHVRDVSRPDHEAQKADVLDVLGQLGIDYESDTRILEVMNKIDACTSEQIADIRRVAAFDARLLPLSAVTGEGVDAFLQAVDRLLSQQSVVVTYVLPAADGAALSWLYQYGEVLERADAESAVHARVRLDPENRARFESRFGYAAERGEDDLA